MDAGRPKGSPELQRRGSALRTEMARPIHSTFCRSSMAVLVSFAAEIHKSGNTCDPSPGQGQGAFAHLAVLAEQVNQILPLNVPEVSNKDRQKKTGSRVFTFIQIGDNSGSAVLASALDLQPGPDHRNRRTGQNDEFHRRPFIRGARCLTAITLEGVKALQ